MTAKVRQRANLFSHSHVDSAREEPRWMGKGLMPRGFLIQMGVHTLKLVAPRSHQPPTTLSCGLPWAAMLFCKNRCGFHCDLFKESNLLSITTWVQQRYKYWCFEIYMSMCVFLDIYRCFSLLFLNIYIYIWKFLHAIDVLIYRYFSLFACFMMLHFLADNRHITFECTVAPLPFRPLIFCQGNCGRKRVGWLHLTSHKGLVCREGYFWYWSRRWMIPCHKKCERIWNAFLVPKRKMEPTKWSLGSHDVPFQKIVFWVTVPFFWPLGK